MKKVFLILFLFSSRLFFAQQVFRISTKTPQDKMGSVATICGYYYGEVSIKSLLIDPKIRISNNTRKLTVISFETTYTQNGVVCMYSKTGDSLDDELKEKLYAVTINDKFPTHRIFISSIKAASTFGDTLYLNPIQLKLTK